MIRAIEGLLPSNHLLCPYAVVLIRTGRQDTPNDISFHATKVAFSFSTGLRWPMTSMNRKLVGQ